MVPFFLKKPRAISSSLNKYTYTLKEIIKKKNFQKFSKKSHKFITFTCSLLKFDVKFICLCLFESYFGFRI